jgi:hypothetical protein
VNVYIDLKTFTVRTNDFVHEEARRKLAAKNTRRRVFNKTANNGIIGLSNFPLLDLGCQGKTGSIKSAVPAMADLL